MSSDFTSLLVKREGAVVSVHLNTPHNGNLVTEEVLDELLSVLEFTHDHPEIRVLTLAATGEDFCVGADRSEFDRLMAQDPTGAGMRALSSKTRRVCDSLASTSAVTIARVHGRAIGAGLALAVFCDLRAGADTSRFRLPELAVGLPVAWGGALPRLLQESGAARTRELVLTGESFDAATARELSVLHKAVPEAELDGVIDAWIRPLLRRPGTALRTTKAILSAYSSVARLTDGSLLDGELLAGALAAHRARAAEGGTPGHL
ncbi:enoyl-CoA hydratase/isomerase family protein [Streptomyces carpaticus]|uniref:Enoyl-CoA hydratase/isomerase family protein n=1 Tax=Streptomyces carpaticus TaxID=285558 RepID=A0ABV4ZWJ7_9ACTN